MNINLIVLAVKRLNAARISLDAQLPISTVLNPDTTHQTQDQIVLYEFNYKKLDQRFFP